MKALLCTNVNRYRVSNLIHYYFFKCAICRLTARERGGPRPRSHVLLETAKPFNYAMNVGASLESPLDSKEPFQTHLQHP